MKEEGGRGEGRGEGGESKHMRGLEKRPGSLSIGTSCLLGHARLLHSIFHVVKGPFCSSCIQHLALDFANSVVFLFQS